MYHPQKMFRFDAGSGELRTTAPMPRLRKRLTADFGDYRNVLQTSKTNPHLSEYSFQNVGNSRSNWKPRQQRPMTTTLNNVKELSAAKKFLIKEPHDKKGVYTKSLRSAALHDKYAPEKSSNDNLLKAQRSLYLFGDDDETERLLTKTDYKTDLQLQADDDDDVVDELTKKKSSSISLPFLDTDYSRHTNNKRVNSSSQSSSSSVSINDNDNEHDNEIEKSSASAAAAASNFEISFVVLFGLAFGLAISKALQCLELYFGWFQQQMLVLRNIFLGSVTMWEFLDFADTTRYGVRTKLLLLPLLGSFTLIYLVTSFFHLAITFMLTQAPQALIELVKKLQFDMKI